MVLSASQVSSLVPVTSKDMAKMPFSESSEPGWAWVSISWNLFPEFQSHSHSWPLSAPVAMTPSSFTAIAFTIDLWCCSMLCMNLPLGRANFLMLSLLADAKEYSLGCCARHLTPFLWCVSVAIVFAAARSHSLTWLS